MLEPNFQIKLVDQSATFGQFIIEPLPQGYGQTLGNSLRRVLLSSIPGAAVTQVKINGVKHKFSTLDGMKEDVIELILNIKQIRVQYTESKPVKLELDKTGPGQVTAGDIKLPGTVTIVNPDLVLATLATAKDRLRLELVVESGFGYMPAEERKSDELGVIPVDASFSPIRRVNYRIEATRVGRQTDLDRLILDVTTDGTIEPQKAFLQSAQLLVGFFNQVVNPKIEENKDEAPIEGSNPALKLSVEELDLPIRIANALRRGGFVTVSDLANANAADLAKVKNLGEKSVGIVKEALAKKDLAIKGETE